MEADDVPHNDNYRGGRFYRALGENEKAEPEVAISCSITGISSGVLRAERKGGKIEISP